MTDYDREFYWCWFMNIKGLGPRSRRRLMDRYGHPSVVYGISAGDLSPFLTDSQIASLESSRNHRKTEAHLHQLKEEGITFIHWESEEYPDRFRDLYDPPYGFYLKGRLPDPAKPAVAVVGSRNPSPYGLKMASRYASELASKGMTIISGMAAGIDSEAHRAALECAGETLGILGGGIDSMYPRENWDLYLEMYRHAGVLSEYTLGVANKAGLFPMRNRLISGISDAILVVEAAEKSGSLITADQGMEQGKDVYAIPGRVTDRLSMGCNHLIAQGALVAESPETMIRDLLESASGRDTLEYAEDISASATGASPLNTSLTADEKRILAVLDEIDPVSFDDILFLTGMDLTQLQHLLVDLEIRSFVTQKRQNMYVRKIL